MSPERARELIQVQLQFTSGYNRNAVRMILGELMRRQGQEAVDRIIADLGLETRYGLAQGTDFSRVGV